MKNETSKRESPAGDASQSPGLPQSSRHPAGPLRYMPGRAQPLQYLHWTGACAALGCFIAVLGCAGLETAGQRPAIFEVTSENGHRVWLFGTVHELPHSQQRQRIDDRRGPSRLRHRMPALPWYQGPVREALNRSGVLAVEVLQRYAKQDLLNLTSSAPQPEACPRLFPALDHAQATRIGDALLSRSIGPDAQAELSAAGALFLIANLQPADEPFPAVGVEFWLQREATRQRMPIIGLEQAGDRLRALSLALGDCQESAQAITHYLQSQEANLEDVEVGLDTFSIWKRGDLDQLEADMNAYATHLPRLHQGFIVYRNLAWIPVFSELLETHPEAMVAVGVAHLAGPHSLVGLLRDQGYQVRRIQ